MRMIRFFLGLALSMFLVAPAFAQSAWKTKATVETVDSQGQVALTISCMIGKDGPALIGTLRGNFLIDYAVKMQIRSPVNLLDAIGFIASEKDHPYQYEAFMNGFDIILMDQDVRKIVELGQNDEQQVFLLAFRLKDRPESQISFGFSARGLIENLSMVFETCGAKSV